MDRKRYKMIACAVLARECYHCAAASRNIVDVAIIEQGLHDVGEERMSSSLQGEIDTVDVEKYEAILLAYGLCNNGVRNLRAAIPIVLPRAHDCITLLMGSKSEYLAYFNAHSGTFFRSVGWAERANSNLANPQSTTREMGMATYDEYVEKYGEENAQYLMETLNDHLKNYTSLAYIDTGLPNTDDHKQAAKEWAQQQGWDYSVVVGKMDLIKRLMDGDWKNEDFLVVQPGQTIDASTDAGIVRIKESRTTESNATSG